MKDLKKRIEKIETLLEEGSISSLTYAALEARLTIEVICYERLMTAYSYTSYADLRRWQPKDVVQQLVQESNDLAATTLTVSVAKTPIDPKSPPRSATDYEKFEYAELGQQIGFNIKEIGKLWHSLSGAALHVQVPKSKDAELSIYGGPDKIGTCIQKALSLFRHIAAGNLLISRPGPEVSFQCHGCGASIKRKKALVSNGMVASCNSESCKESYILTISEAGIEFSRRQLSFPCDECGAPIEIPTKLAEELRIDQSLTAKCGDCGNESLIMLRPCKAVPSKEPSTGASSL